MNMRVGKISKRGSVRYLENDLPDNIIKKDGKYYNKETGKFLEMKEVNFEEFFDETNSSERTITWMK